MIKTDQWLLGLDVGVGLTESGHKGSFWGNENVLQLDHHTAVYICQNSLNYILKMGAFYVNYLNKIDFF